MLLFFIASIWKYTLKPLFWWKKTKLLFYGCIPLVFELAVHLSQRLFLSGGVAYRSCSLVVFMYRWQWKKKIWLMHRFNISRFFIDNLLHSSICGQKNIAEFFCTRQRCETSHSSQPEIEAGKRHRAPPGGCDIHDTLTIATSWM